MNVLATIYNTDLKPVSYINGFKSLIRTDRYRNAGEFTMVVSVDAALFGVLLSNTMLFIVFSDDNSTYIIEDIEPNLSIAGKTNQVTISGRDLKAIYAYRIVWKQQTVSGTVLERMSKLLMKNAINPTIARRALPYVQAITAENGASGSNSNSQYTGDNLMDALIDILGSDSLGWRVTLSVWEKKIINTLFTGSDKTNSVFFDDRLGNLSDMSYTYSLRDSANNALVGGEGEGANRGYYTLNALDVTGFDYREMFVDARDIQSETTDADGNTVSLSTGEYLNSLNARGKEKLAAAQPQQSLAFETQESVYAYGEHYALGDLVTVRNHNGMGIDAKCRVVAVTRSVDADGQTVTPAFEIINATVSS